MLKILPRQDIDTEAWDACIESSAQRIVYGYSWYLDAVLPAPDWKWEGIVLATRNDTYQAVMAIPLRRKFPLVWVVHQPFFCQLLAVFSRSTTVNWRPFFTLLIERYPYGAVLRLWQQPDQALLTENKQPSTQILDLSPEYQTVYQKYTADRKTNLQRAKAANWDVVDSDNVNPLLVLFLENHAAGISGGVADWAYAMLRNVVEVLQKRQVALLRYAMQHGRIEAGALFVREGQRIIYLFNAASVNGRKGNARTLLLDQLIQEHAETGYILDFESPEKPSIRAFYKSFGATELPFSELRWNHLNPLLKALLRIRRYLT